MTGAPTLSFVLACALAMGAAGCGDRQARPARVADSPQRLDLTLRVAWSDGHGASGSAILRCRGGRSYASGHLRGRARRLCARRGELARVLVATPPPNRACTEIYGGPSTARVTGRAGTRTLDRRFARTNGCEIADWDTAGDLLPPPS